MPLLIRSTPLTRTTAPASSLNSQGESSTTQVVSQSTATSASPSTSTVDATSTVDQVEDTASQIIQASPEGMLAQSIAGDAAKSKTGVILTGAAIVGFFMFRRKLLRG